jgi:hypothetical protein
VIETRISASNTAVSPERTRIQKFIHKKPAHLLINVNYDYGHYDIPRRMPTRCAPPPHTNMMQCPDIIMMLPG